MREDVRVWRTGAIQTILRHVLMEKVIFEAADLAMPDW